MCLFIFILLVLNGAHVLVVYKIFLRGVGVFVQFLVYRACASSLNIVIKVCCLKSSHLPP